MPYTQLVLPRSKRITTRIYRTVRAMWRDTSALIREFQRPILVFILATLGGGWVYGELMVMAGYDRLPYHDLPYIMLALMIVETPIDLPSEWYLIIFWYALPIIAVYVIGRGAADFFRLFFDRTGRQLAWEEALASTYRHHMIVLGIGHVGIRVVRMLADLGFDVVVIDKEIDDETDVELNELGVPSIIGDGIKIATLEKAGLRHAQALIICTSNDHVNLEVVMRARDMQPDIRIVVRMWDAQFAQQLKRFMNVDAVISSSDLAAPAFAGMAAGVEITQTLTIKDVEYSMIRLQVEPDSFLDGDSIEQLQQRHDMDIVLHSHAQNGEVDVHPEGDICVQPGDTLVVFARHDRIIDIANRNRRGSDKRRQGKSRLVPGGD